MSRGNRKGPIFDDDLDRRYFYETIRDTARRYAIRPHAVCLMNNHYHLVFDTPRDNVSHAMQHLNGLFAQTSNRRHGRTGHLFEARFRSLVIQREGYLRRVARYVVLNPVRARITMMPEQWAWSTYPATAGLEPPPDWLYLDWLAWAFDSPTREDAQSRYREYVNAPTARKAKIDTGALAVGSQQFRKSVAGLHDSDDRPLPVGFQTPERPPLDSLFSEVVSALLRDRAIENAHVAHGYSLAEIARHLRIHRSTVSRAFKRSQQDNPAPHPFLQSRIMA